LAAAGLEAGEPPEASAEGPTIAAATTSPATAPVNGALHLFAVDDMHPSDVGGGACRHPPPSRIRAATETALKQRGFFSGSSAAGRENSEL